MKKIRKSQLLPVIGFILIGAIAGILSLTRQNQKPLFTKEDQNQVRPKLSMIEYSEAKPVNGKKEIRSSNYGFAVIFPQYYKVLKGRSFNPEYPENESVDIGVSDPKEEGGLIFNTTIRFLNGKTLKLKAEEEISFLQEDSGDEKGKKIELREIAVQGQKGYEYKYKNAFQQDEIIRYYSHNNLCYSIHAMRKTGTRFTPDQEKEIYNVFSSFRIIN